MSCSVLIYRWIDLVAFHFPERDCWKVEKNVDGTVNATAPQDYWGKLKWSFFLWNNQRYVFVISPWKDFKVPHVRVSRMIE